MIYEIQIPSTVKIAGFDFEVRMSSITDGELECADLYGQTHNRKQIIRMNQTETPQHISECFIHEVIHAVNGIFTDSKMTENQVQSSAAGLHQVFEQLGIRFVK